MDVNSDCSATYGYTRSWVSFVATVLLSPLSRQMVTRDESDILVARSALLCEPESIVLRVQVLQTTECGPQISFENLDRNPQTGADSEFSTIVRLCWKPPSWPRIRGISKK
jgi:hypothetical protein